MVTGTDHSTPRRALLAAAATGLAALAGCGGGDGDGSGDGDGDGDGSTTEPARTTTGSGTPPTTTAALALDWADPFYRSTEDGKLIVALNVSNPSETERSGTVRVHFERNNQTYEQTAQVTLEPGASRVVELAFPTVNRSATDGLTVYREIS